MSRRSVVAFELEGDLDDVRLIELASPVRWLAPVLSDGIADFGDPGLVEINDIEDRGLPVLRKERTGSDSLVPARVVTLLEQEAGQLGHRLRRVIEASQEFRKGPRKALAQPEHAMGGAVSEIGCITWVVG